MKAFAIEAADQPATLTTLPKPEVGDSQALIAIQAASLNGFDVFEANGYLFGMMEHSLPTVIGRDFAGVVAEVGAAYGDFAVGDEVFGFVPSAPPLKNGTFAEFVAGGAELVMLAKPAGLDFQHAGALPLAGSAAVDLLDAVAAGPGDVVLLVGATGGVGSLILQLASQRGIKVIATARPDKDAFVRGLGAAETVDYTDGDVAAAVRKIHPDGVDAVIDVVSQKDALADVAKVLGTGGRLASLVGAADVEQLAASGIQGTNVLAAPTAEKLRHLAGMVESGELTIPIQATYPLDEASQALAAFRAGTTGKIILVP